jgi:hypothetical protein
MTEMKQATDTVIPDTLHDLAAQVSEIERRTRAFAAEHPLATLGAALTFGYMLGRTFGRGAR